MVLYAKFIYSWSVLTVLHRSFKLFTLLVCSQFLGLSKILFVLEIRGSFACCQMYVVSYTFARVVRYSSLSSSPSQFCNNVSVSREM